MASLETVMSAELMCTDGAGMVQLIVDPKTILVEGQIAGNILDGVGEVNIQAFQSCYITGGSCTPLTAIWVPGNPTVLMCGAPALAQLSLAPCAIQAAVDVIMAGATGGADDEGAGPCVVYIVSPNNSSVFV